MKINTGLLLFTFCAVIACAKPVEIHLMREVESSGRPVLVLSHDYPGKYHDSLLQQELTPGANLVDLDEYPGSDVFFQIYETGFQKVEGTLEELQTCVDSSSPFFLFREREILLEYVINENGRSFDRSDCIRNEEWISDRQMIPILDDDFQISAICMSFAVNYHRVQDGYGVFFGKMNKDFEEIQEAPEKPYVYENPMLHIGTPLVFRICGSPAREETYAKIVAKEIRLKAIPAPSRDQEPLADAAWENAKFAKTSSGDFAGVMNPPADRVLAYFSDFDISIPRSVQFESYLDQDNLKTVWMTIHLTDLPEFLISNNLAIGATNIHPRSEHHMPIANIRHPNETWRVDYIIQPDPTYINMSIKLESKPTRDTTSKAFLNDAKQWSENRIMIVE